MAIYQTTKDLTKFTIAGASAVLVDFLVYYLCSTFLDVDVSRAIGYFSGTVVTYNLNKFWTWRLNDRNQKRLYRFLVLYILSGIGNVYINSLALNLLPDSELILQIKEASGSLLELAAFKIDKFAAFLIATAFSVLINFIGQKIWVFRKNQS